MAPISLFYIQKVSLITPRQRDALSLNHVVKSAHNLFTDKSLDLERIVTRIVSKLSSQVVKVMRTY